MTDQATASPSDDTSLPLEIKKKLTQLMTIAAQSAVPAQGYTPKSRLGLPPFMEVAVMHFMQLHDQKVNHFDGEQVGVWIGMMFEALTEITDELAAVAINPDRMYAYRDLAHKLRVMSAQLDQNQHYGDILRADHAKLLSSVIDGAIASQGAAYSISNNAHGAFMEVAKNKLLNGETCTSNLERFITPLDRD